MKKRLRAGVVLAILLFCAGLFGCTAAAPAEESAAISESAAPALSYAEQMAAAHKTVTSDAAQHVNYLSEIHLSDGKLWCLGMDGQQWKLLCTDPYTGVSSVQSLTLPPAATPADGETVMQQLKGFCRTPDGAQYLLLNETFVPTQADDSAPSENYMPGKQRFSLCRIAADGTLDSVALQLPTELQKPVSGYISTGWGDCLLCDEQGRLYIQLSLMESTGTDGQYYLKQSWLLRLSETGECTVVLAGKAILDALPLPSGQLLLLTNEAAGEAQERRRLLSVDGWDGTAGLPTALDLDWESLTGPNGPNGMTADGTQGDSLLMWDTYALYRVDAAQETAEPVLVWGDYGIDLVNSWIKNYVFMLDDGVVLTVIKAPNEPLTFHLLKPGGIDAAAGGEVVTLGVSGELSADLKNLVADYNLTAPTVYVQIVDYSDEAAAAAGFASGTEMLNNAILEGKAPDMMVLPNDLGAQNLVRKGFFADLYPYIDADPELRREDFLPNILSACETDGTLPMLMPSYLLLTAAGSPATVGGQTGWTMETFESVCANADENPFFGVDRNTMLLYLMRAGGKRYVDYAAGECHFDTPEFRRLLSVCAAYPAEAAAFDSDPKPALSSGGALLKMVILTDFRTALQLRYEFDGDFVFKGFPTSPGGAIIAPTLRLGMTSVCKNPEAAWQFMRRCLLPDFQDRLTQTRNLPLRRDSLQSAAEAALLPCESNYSWPSYLSGLTDEQIAYWQQGVPSADCDAVLTLIESADTLDAYDSVVFDILLEEAQNCFSGVRSADETASLIQSRVSTYLAEIG